MPRQFDLPITPTDVAESLPHRVSDSSEVAFQNNGVLLGRRNLIRAKVLQQSLEVTLRADVYKRQYPAAVNRDISS